MIFFLIPTTPKASTIITIITPLNNINIRYDIVNIVVVVIFVGGGGGSSDLGISGVWGKKGYGGGGASIDGRKIKGLRFRLVSCGVGWDV